MSLEVASDGINEIAVLLNSAMQTEKGIRKNLEVLEAQRERCLKAICEERAKGFQYEQGVAKAKGIQVGKVQNKRIWENHWLLGKDIQGPGAEELSGPTQCCKKYLEAAMEQGVPEYAYVSRQLLENNFCVLDDFHTNEGCRAMREEIYALSAKDQMSPGALFRSDEPATTLRSDFVAWKEEGEEDVPACSAYLEHLDVFIQKIAVFLDAAVGKPYGWKVKHRSKMMCSIYPGTGGHYVKHYDNTACNTRKMTAILYLNDGWAPDDGGHIRIGTPYQATEEESRFTDIAPLKSRLLLFWSDQRCPHEVAPTWKTRCAVTTWYLDGEDDEEGPGDEMR
eukprot:TRINITY_DN6460_c0_g1_i1.p1 TRINITY_DN6460_c0_g1~~TRINITY_DN6460_c0_g1_i1.p1  ORF type:complete len:337 (+),score=70.36 TRINITY_DN6460_c0_g1_i1:259-1269(+)